MDLVCVGDLNSKCLISPLEHKLLEGRTTYGTFILSINSTVLYNSQALKD